MIAYIIGFCLGVAIYHIINSALCYKSEMLISQNSKMLRPEPTLLELMNQAVHELGLVEKFKDPNFTLAESTLSVSTWEQIRKWFKNKTRARLSIDLELAALIVIICDLKSEGGFDSTLEICTRDSINEWFERESKQTNPYDFKVIDALLLRVICDDLPGESS